MGGKTSGLDALKARRAELVAAVETKTVPVPGWGGQLNLQIRAIDHGTLRKYMIRTEKAKGPEARANVELSGAAGMIAEATDAVLLAGENGEPLELALTDDAFVDAMGLTPNPELRTLTIIRAMCLGRDGAVMALSREVVEHSGYADDEADEDFQGE